MIQLVVFTLGEEGYGLPITQVQEIIHYSRPRTVPTSAQAIAGVINLRSKIIPICDLADALGLARHVPMIAYDDGEESEEPVDRRKIVILETSHGAAGLVVDEVDKVLNVDESNVDASRGTDADYVRGIARVGEQLLVLLAPDALVETLGLADTNLVRHLQPVEQVAA